MFVYANLIGNWTELTEDDCINGLLPQDFVEKCLIAENAFENFKQNNEFVEVIVKNNAYHIHKSCIQFTYTK